MISYFSLIGSIGCVAEAQKMALVESFRARAQGGDWGQVQKDMLLLMGQSARSRVSRWIRGARHMHAEIRNQLSMYPGAVDRFIFDNTSFVGTDVQKLSPEFALRAFVCSSHPPL